MNPVDKYYTKFYALALHRLGRYLGTFRIVIAALKDSTEWRLKNIFHQRILYVLYMVSLGWSGPNSWQLSRSKFVAPRQACQKCQKSQHNLKAIYSIRKQNSIKKKHKLMADHPRMTMVLYVHEPCFWYKEYPASRFQRHYI